MTTRKLLDRERSLVAEVLLEKLIYLGSGSVCYRSWRWASQSNGLSDKVPRDTASRSSASTYYILDVIYFSEVTTWQIVVVRDYPQLGGWKSTALWGLSTSFVLCSPRWGDDERENHRRCHHSRDHMECSAICATDLLHVSNE